MDIFEKAKTYGSFNNWLSSIPEEDLQFISDIGDKADKELKDEADIDAFDQMCALAMYFSGRGDEGLSEEQLQELFTSLIVFVSCEANIRKGYMTKEGMYSMVPNEDTAKLKMTEAGMKSVKDMIGNKDAAA